MDSTKDSIEISLIIPIWNEEDAINELYLRASKTLNNLSKNHEIVFVDDGSADGSFDVMMKICQKDKKVKIIRLMRNFGHNQAVNAGFIHARGEIIALIDGDLQNDPEDIAAYYNELKQGYDVIRGWRKERSHPLWRRFFSYYVNKLISFLTGVKLNDYGCSLFMCKRHIVDHFNQFSERSRFTSALLSWIGGRTKEIVVSHHPRPKGKSKYGFLKLSTLTIDLITEFTILPLQVFTLMGFIVALISSLNLFYSVYTYYFSGREDWFALLLNINIFLVSILFFFLGVLGEYIGRIYTDVKKRPYYIIKEIVGD